MVDRIEPKSLPLTKSKNNDIDISTSRFIQTVPTEERHQTNRNTSDEFSSREYKDGREGFRSCDTMDAHKGQINDNLCNDVQVKIYNSVNADFQPADVQDTYTVQHFKVKAPIDILLSEMMSMECNMLFNDLNSMVSDCNKLIYIIPDIIVEILFHNQEIIMKLLGRTVSDYDRKINSRGVTLTNLLIQIPNLKVLVVGSEAAVMYRLKSEALKNKIKKMLNDLEVELESLRKKATKVSEKEDSGSTSMLMKMKKQQDVQVVGSGQPTETRVIHVSILIHV